MKIEKVKKMKALTLKNIDHEIYKRFKIACEENNTSIRNAIICFMQEYGSHIYDKKIRQN